MPTVQQINSTLYCIDCHDIQRKNRTGSYVFKDQNSISLIETSASPSIPYILEGLKQLEIKLEDIKYIIVTHIHLDHAGGAGLMLQHCPNAKLIVHPKGARHLVDPSRLIAGARAVYGEEFDQLFDPIIPISEERILTVADGEKLKLSDRTFTFYHTPGHANHHIAIHDSETNGLFTGDTAGIYYRELDDENFNLVMPSTSPSQFDPEAMLKSLQLFSDLQAQSIFFGHYGQHDHPEEVFKQVRYWLPIFIAEAEKAMAKPLSFEERVQETTDSLMTICTDFLLSKGLTKEHPVFEILSLDLSVSSMGLIDYLTKKQ
ncbi:MBL fold metallo-hydrolase [Bacillus sp. AGMB 02131]|uniref:MBL fold metallo-hydrolase n=1 Tax=Peribacillus faecalis TaxID=2772559 RepID=A0A927CWI9_9BACI|nr:MBL fold metallo-hydrolase [Peribacillus faecalis]MBD3106905.1 MBL fold metallo-hydrolase [Peribacillus faecalis]